MSHILKRILFPLKISNISTINASNNAESLSSAHIPLNSPEFSSQLAPDEDDWSLMDQIMTDDLYKIHSIEI
jgi:hypothetical protein